VYFALERADLVKRRLAAHRLRDELPTLPIAVVSQVIDLMNANCVGVIVEAIKRAEDHFGHEVGLAVFDTYSKGIAAGGGDENQAKDQNIAVANLRRVIDKVSVHIAGIGHTGKDETRGERGSNARLADVDLQVQLSGDMLKTATVTKANDQPLGPLTSFQLEPFDFEPDEDGDPFQTWILSKKVIQAAADTVGRKMTDRQRIAVEALAEVTISRGAPLPPEYGLPRDIRAVTDEVWKAELVHKGQLDPKGGNPWSRYRELCNSLMARHIIGARDQYVWLAKPPAGADNK
jgi:hypothetical protein